MKPWSLLQKPAALIILAGIFLHIGAVGQAKEIRLRTETITTSPASKPALAAQFQSEGLSFQAPASGLFLVQFTHPLAPAERAELRTRGVELLKYVPDDAFIARFNRVTPAGVAAESFVTWRRGPASGHRSRSGCG